MAEFALTASVISVLGFGVQVCQGIWVYYSSYKDQDEKVAEMLNSVHTLKGTCKVLDSMTKDLVGKTFPKESVDNVNKSLENCKEHLKRLDKKLGKVKRVQKPSEIGFRKMLAKMRMTLYPFKESTLVKLREIVRESLQNLDLAVDVLNLCVLPCCRLIVAKAFG